MKRPHPPYAPPRVVDTEPLGATEIGHSGDQSCAAGPADVRKLRRPYERPRILQTMPLTSDEIEVD
jgi:hypothetical protein